jgi:hypothetical protein
MSKPRGIALSPNRDLARGYSSRASKLSAMRARGSLMSAFPGPLYS